MKKSNKIKVSVFIPCYNMGAFINDAIDSVYAQTYKDYEIIIVDDGSTDEYTHEQLKKISKIHPDIRLFYKENSGLSGAKNYGIERAVGEYIVCLDADDKLAPAFIEKTVKVLEQRKNDKVAFVTTWVQEFGIRDNIWKTSGYDVTKLLITNTVHAGSIFRKDVWDKVGGFKKVGASYEDWEFWMNIVEHGYKWDIVEEVLFYYRIRANSLLSSAQSSHLEIYNTNYELHKKLYGKFEKEFALENARVIKELRNSIAEKDKSIEELLQYKDEVIKLREKIYWLRDEIHGLRSSRVLSKVIKLREIAGNTRGKLNNLPSKTIHKTRVIVAPVIPSQIRKAAKYAYKASRQTIAKKNKVVSWEFVDNTEWDKRINLVSVVIPFFNRADTIDDTIQSLGSQTFKNFETILVDDGSTDSMSQKKIDELNIKYPEIKIIRQKNAGVASARNNGINSANGKYVVCLDSDDILEPTYLEKCTIVLETSPDISVVTTHKNMFGVVNEAYENAKYNPVELIKNNMVITAAEFKKEAWHVSGGYKSGIGYEDWEFWISMAEHGFWGKLIPEKLFRYRTSMQSRYIEDKDTHWDTIKNIQNLHPKYLKKIRTLIKKRNIKHAVTPKSGFINLDKQDMYRSANEDLPNILVAIPWMTFGGAETLIINFCKEVKSTFNLSFITGLDSGNEWEYKFREISEQIYHLANLFDDEKLYLEFISNYITTRNISVLHIIHTSFMKSMLPEIKKRHPELKIIMTVFNDRAEHFENSVLEQDCIDVFTTDNAKVAEHYKKELKADHSVKVIPNGINSTNIFNPDLIERDKVRKELSINDNELGVFFIGRLSEEKNPNVFIAAAKQVLNNKENNNIKFFIIGDGHMRTALEEEIKKIGNDNIKYLGYQTEIEKYLSAADIFVLPSSVEGFPLSILEAMAMRVVVIASDVGAVAEVVDNGKQGYVVKPGSQEEISEHITSLNKNPKLLSEMKHEARNKVEHKYSNIILGQNYTKLYKDIAE